MRNTVILGLVFAASVGMIDQSNLAAVPTARVASESTIAIQPVQEYFLPFESNGKGNRPGLLPRERMTHLGTRFWHDGPEW